MSEAFLRPPIHIPREGSHTNSVAALIKQVLYVFQQTDTPCDEIRYDVIWEKEYAMFDAYYCLLQHGFSCQVYTTAHLTDFVERGLDVIREQYGVYWNPSFEAHFTPEEVTRLQDLARRDRERFQPYLNTGQYKEVARSATLEEIQTMLASGCVAEMTADNVFSMSSKVLTVPGTTQADEQYLWLYWPETPFWQSLTVARDTWSSFAEKIRLDLDVTTIWR